MTINAFSSVAAVLAALGIGSVASAVTQFDQNVTPDVIFGSGNANGAFTTDREPTAGFGIELGLRAKLRFDSNNQPQNVFNSNGDGSYTFQTGTPPTGFSFAPNSPTTPTWNFEWSINTAQNSPSALSILQLADYTYELRLDGDPTAGTDFLTFDPINVTNADHGIGNNMTANGAGDDLPRSDGQYASLIASQNVAQNSWSYEFFNNPATALENFDPNAPGIYTIQLEAFDKVTGLSAASASIDVNVVPEPATLALAGLGLAGVAAVARRRRQI